MRSEEEAQGCCGGWQSLVREYLSMRRPKSLVKKPYDSRKRPKDAYLR